VIDPSIREDRPEFDDSTLRQFAGLWLAAFLGLAAFHGLYRGRPTLGVVLAVIALAGGLSGLVRPPSVRVLFATAMGLAMPIGWVVSRVLLGTLFYVVITPVSVLFRLIGRDALARQADKAAPTHWVPREQPTDPRQYLRQS
jgi:hypothetical protein